MNITRENTSELDAILTVTIEKNDYEATVNDVLKNYRKKANIPGFRPGMVPAGLIKKMYGKAALAEEVNKLLSKSLTDYLHTENLNILGEPLPNEEKQPPIDWDNQAEYHFLFDIGLAPQIDINLDKQVRMPYYQIVAEDETVSKQLDEFAVRAGENKVVESVEEKDSVRGNFVQLDEEGNELQDGIEAEKVVIAIDLMKDEETKASFLGKKAGDVVVFDPIKAYDNKHEVSHMLNISHEDAENLSGNFSFSIIEALRFEKAELNRDLFTKTYGEDSGIETEEEFRAKTKADIEENLVHSSDYKFALDCKKALLEEIKFGLPETFLKRWIKATNEKMTVEMIEQDFDSFALDLKWQLIRDNIIKNNNLQVTEEDIRDLAKNLATLQFMQYGLTSFSDEYLEKYTGQILQNEEERRKLVTRQLENMVIATIKDRVSLDKIEITLNEFNKMLEK